MRRNGITTFSLALALALAPAGMAAAQGGNNRPDRRPERPPAAQDDGPRRGQPGPDAMLLRGITLTPEQAARVAALRQAERSKAEAGRERRSPGARAGSRGDSARAPLRRPERARGDTTAMAERRARMQAQRERHVASLRKILTRDQRAQLDRNLAELASRGAQRGRQVGPESPARRGPSR